MATLYIIYNKNVKLAYEKNKEVGLFFLFFSIRYLQGLPIWTNTQLHKCYNLKISLEKFLVYVGLEIIMFLIGYTSIHGHWQTVTFTGHKDFLWVMSQNNFHWIPSKLQF